MEENTRLAEALAQRYRIESEVDAGGMGTVYRARDLKHDRTVAIKVLRPELTEAIGTDRFLREIRTTANLSHPHILPLFDSGEADGFLFYVLPFIRGESLKDRLEREGQLPAEDAIRIVQEVADALTYAHEEGVIHRDVKPANIMLERGHALLMDFGIAQARAGADETRLTGTSEALGTPAYMSPEQISGEGEVDGRSDQYALACVLYEMLAGRPPFTGADAQAVMRQHLVAEAPRVTGGRARVPQGVAEATHRAMAKAPSDRFRTMAEFGTALAEGRGALHAAPTPGSRRRAVVVGGPAVLAAVVVAVAVAVGLWSRGEGVATVEGLVAVLPFENRTGDPGLEDLGAIAAEWIGDGLTSIDAAQLVPLEAVSEAVSASGVADPLPAVVRRTGAGLAVTGSYNLTGDSIEIRAQLVNASDGRVVASVGPERSHRSRPTGALGPLGQRIMGQVALHLQEDVSSGLLFPRSPPDYRAYEAYLAGVELFLNERYPEAIQEFDRARQRDSTFWTPLLQTATAYSNLGQPARRDSVLRLVEPHRSELSRIERIWLDWAQANVRGDLPAAYRYARDWLDRIPSSVTRFLVSGAAFALNRPGEAVEVLQQEPEDAQVRSTWVHFHVRLTLALHVLGEHEEELVAARKARELFPDDPRAVILEARALAALGETAEVERRAHELTMLPSGSVETAGHLMVLGDALAGHGYQGAAERVYEQGLQALEYDDAPASADRHQALAEVLRRIGRLEDAAAHAEAAYAEAPEDAAAHGLVGLVSAQRGHREKAEGVLAEMAAGQDPYDRGATPYRRATIRSRLGDLDRAVALLQQAHAQGRGIDYDMRFNPDLRPLRGHAEYQELIRPKG